MSVATLQAPEAATAALKFSIGAHLARTRIGGAADSCTAQIQAPVFVIDRAEPLSVSDLKRLQPVAWRFVLSQNGVPCATGDVTKTDGSYELSMVIPGESPARKLIEAFRVAADAIDRQARSNAFEFRLIEAPAFNVDAVWLHGDGDWFAVVHVPGPSINGDLVSADRFVDIFNHVQSLKRRKRVDLDYEREPEIVASVSPRALESR